MRRTVRFLIAGTSPRRVSLLRVSRGVVSHSSVTLLTGAHLHRMTLHAMGRWRLGPEAQAASKWTSAGNVPKIRGYADRTPRGGTAFNPTSEQRS